MKLLEKWKICGVGFIFLSSLASHQPHSSTCLLGLMTKGDILLSDWCRNLWLSFGQSHHSRKSSPCASWYYILYSQPAFFKLRVLSRVSTRFLLYNISYAKLHVLSTLYATHHWRGALVLESSIESFSLTLLAPTHQLDMSVRRWRWFEIRGNYQHLWGYDCQK